MRMLKVDYICTKASKRLYSYALRILKQSGAPANK
jgi:hypothetical protein